MENASKALLIAGEILIGVMILSIGVFLFRNLAGESREFYEEMEKTTISEFNSKFYGSREVASKKIPVAVTIHDITSLANFAKKHNEQYEIANESSYSDGTLYVQIDIQGVQTKVEKLSNDQIINLIKNNSITKVGSSTITKYFKATRVDVSEADGMVNHIIFQEFSTQDYANFQSVSGD